MIPIRPKVSEAFAPLLDLLGDHLLTAAEVAAHTRYSIDHLANLRRAEKWIPWVQFDTGAVRYRAADVVAAQIAGTQGPVTVDRVCLAIAACPDLTPAAKAAAQGAVRRAFLETPNKG